MDLPTLNALRASLESGRRFEGVIRAAARRYGVDPHLVLSIVMAESNFDDRALSHKGAIGLMQLMPATARMHNVSNLYDPAQNVYGGVRHLKSLIDRFQGNLLLAIAAYNAGAAAVRKYNSIPPYPETKAYVHRVLAYYRFYRESEIALFDERP